MRQGRKPLSAIVVDILADAGSWMSREELQAATHCSEVAVDDAIADLVIESRVDFRENVGYRLGGTPAARAALRRLVHAKAGTKAFVLARQDKSGEMRVGVAEMNAELGRVMYEIALPPADAGADPLDHLQRQVEGVLAFMDGKEAPVESAA
jgi:hypothetical protein